MLRSLAVIVLAGFWAARTAEAADTDEVKFKPRKYEPRKTFQENAYKDNPYQPSGKSFSIGKPIESPKSSGGWRLFKSREKALESKEIQDEKTVDGQPYVQQKHISVPTIKADSKDIPEKKPFKESGTKLTDHSYKPSDTPQPKNPLLKPRQSIETPQ